MKKMWPGGLRRSHGFHPTRKEELCQQNIILVYVIITKMVNLTTAVGAPVQWIGIGSYLKMCECSADRI